MTPDLSKMSAEEKRALLATLLQRQADSEKSEFALSHGQRALWFVYALDRSSSAYNIAGALRIRSAVDRAALKRAWHGVVKRHAALRASFPVVDGEPRQVIAPPHEPALDEVDATGLSEDALLAQVVAWNRRPFVLETGPVYRISLFGVRDDDHVLLFSVHHIAADASALGIILEEMLAAYAAEVEGRSARLPALGASYRDFVDWQAKHLATDSSRLEAYWTAALAGERPELAISPRTRVPGQPIVGALHSFELPGTLAADVRRLARAEGVTPFVILLSAFVACLSRQSGQHDIVVGTPVSGRSRLEFERVVGYFVNPLALRARLDDDPSFVGLARRMRETVKDGLAHQDYPFPLLVEKLRPARDASLTPIFQAMFNLLRLPSPSSRLSAGGLSFEPYAVPQEEGQFALALDVLELGDQMRADLRFDRNLFDQQDAERFAERLVTLLTSAVSAPETRVSRLRLLPDAELALVVDEWNRTEVPLTGAITAARMFESVASASPNATAVRDRHRYLTYSALEAAANRLANHLRRLGIERKSLVGISLDRSVDMVVALLGVMKAGAGYVPLDPSYPAARLQHMAVDSGLALMITEERYRELWRHIVAAPQVLMDADRAAIDANEAVPAPHVSDPHDVAYVIYTSGSTGRPKGVVIEHRALVNFLQSMRSAPGLTANDRLLAVTTLSFDIAGLELFGPLIAGGCIVLTSREEALDGRRLTALLADEAITMLQATPATWRLLLAAGWRGTPGLKMLCGGEALPGALAADLLARGGELWNMYGPTETTVWSTIERIEPGRPITIGRPIANTQCYVLDDQRAPVGVGMVGELYIGGDGLARGYHERPELTAERFVSRPFGRSARMYRTGDLARWGADGRLECLGRIDHQVKVRGFRIELGEVETALSGLPGVRDAVAVVREDASGEGRLIAYVIPSGQAIDHGELRRGLKDQLPDHMVPTLIVAVESFPLTQNGKIDRRALPSPEVELSAADADSAPETRTEIALAEIWGAVLGGANWSIADNFFERGGHSLLAAQLVARIDHTFGITLPLRTVFEAPTLKAMAAAIDRIAGQPSGSTQLRIPTRSPGAILPASFTQERLWFLHRLWPESAAYHVPLALRLRGTLERAVLIESWTAVVQRHEALRTRLRIVDGTLIQVIDGQPPVLEVVDLSGVPAAVRPDAVRRNVERIVRTPFDLEAGPLVRAALITEAPTSHLLVVVLHHAIADQWSVGVLAQEWASLYAAAIRGTDAELPAPAVQFADYAVWERARVEGPDGAKGLQFWVERLTRVPELNVPTDRPRPAATTLRGATLTARLEADLLRRAAAFAAESRVTLASALMAGFAAVLHRYTGQEDFAVGVPVANRDSADVERTVGAFINTVAVRLETAPAASYRQLAAHVQERLLEALTHRDIPFDRVVTELQPTRDLSRGPIVQVMFNVLNAPLPPIAWPGVEWSPETIDRGSAQLDFTVYVEPVSGAIAVEYNTDLFDEATMRQLVEHYEQVLTWMTAEPAREVGAGELLTAAEQSLLAEVNATALAYSPDESVDQLFARQAAATPAAVAVRSSGAGTLTYGALDAQATQLAAFLTAAGVGPNVRVGICLQRTPALLVALVGVLRAGGAYVPLDPAFPVQRLEWMLEDAALPLVLADAQTAALVTRPGVRVVRIDTDWPTIAAAPAVAPPAAVGEDLAYVLFTSGSTGRPKGVAIPRRALTNFIRAMQQAPGLTASDVLVAVTTLSFDIAGLELWLPLSVGATIALATREEASDGRALQRLIEGVGGTVLQATPATWRMLLDAGWVGTPGLTMLCGGEALPADLAAQLRPRGRALWNLYGPTETTIWSLIEPMGDGPITIGRPIANTQVHVVDARLQRAPVGVPGEICLGGDGVALGYLDRPALTAEKFVADRFAGRPGATMYRTGDLGRVRRDGRVECLGRVDTQVKLRGFRIELGEIEAALLQAQPGIQDAVVVLVGSGAEARLVGCVRLTPGAALDSEAVRAALRQRLPEYMVPAAVLAVEAYPLTANRKVDRRRLAEEMTAAVRDRTAAAGTPPTTETERALAAVWLQVLPAPQVSVEDDFFERGGHSLLAAQLIARIDQTFGITLPLRTLFEAPTLGSLAARIEALAGEREEIEL
jgi:amino acid adenylation domain-containing protein